MGHFYFVRHGQTVWNVEGKICGATDIALTQLGNRNRKEDIRRAYPGRRDSVFPFDAGCRYSKTHF